MNQTPLVNLKTAYETLRANHNTFKKTFKTIETLEERGKLPTYTYINRDLVKKVYDVNQLAEYFGLVIKNGDDVDLSDLDDDHKELYLILQKIDMPMDKIKVEKEFWASRKVKTQYMRDVGSVIPIDEAISVIETGVINFKTKMYNIPTGLKSTFPNTSIDLINKLDNMINEAFEELHIIGFNIENEDETSDQ